MSSSTSRSQLITSQQNIQYLFKICSQFLVEKYNLDIPEANLRSFLQSGIQELTQFYVANPPLPSIEDFNKRVIVRVKEKAMLHLRASSMPSHPPPPHKIPSSNIIKPKEEIAPRADSTSDPSLMSSPPPNYQKDPGNMLPLPSMETIQTNTENDNEDSFVKKLQELELQRSASIAPQDQVTATKNQGSVQTPSSYLTAPVPPPAPPSAPTVLYVPTVTNVSKLSKSIVIHSAERLWDYFHDRNAFMWAGPTPDSSSLSVVSLVLPSIVASLTPVVELHIQGAGGNHIDIHCVCSQRSGAIWDIWKPASVNEASLRTIACPWNIQLRDVLHQPLDLGSDGITIIDAALMPYGNSTRMKFSNHSFLQKGSLIMHKDVNGNIVKHRVLQVSDIGIEVEGDLTKSEGVIYGVWDMQSSIILEVTKNETETSGRK